MKTIENTIKDVSLTQIKRIRRLFAIERLNSPYHAAPISLSSLSWKASITSGLCMDVGRLVSTSRCHHHHHQCHHIFIIINILMTAIIFVFYHCHHGHDNLNVSITVIITFRSSKRLMIIPILSRLKSIFTIIKAIISSISRSNSSNNINNSSSRNTIKVNMSM